MADDLFNDVLNLEEDFYREGYEAGIADSRHAGLVEGKVFGIEKGYEKAIELGRLRGRALLWRYRLSGNEKRVPDKENVEDTTDVMTTPAKALDTLLLESQGITSGSRLQRHVEALLLLTDPAMIARDNSDAAVAEFDDCLAKARTKTKVIVNIAGESLNSESTTNTGIEDATGLNARH